jgi:hypothetical protein
VQDKRTNALAGQADREREKGRTTENKEANVTVACTTKSSKESKSDIRVRDVSCTAPVVRHPGGKKTNERKKGSRINRLRNFFFYFFLCAFISFFQLNSG